MFKDKRAVSAVVATLLIVLVSIAAVLILWQVLKPAIEKSASRVSTECIDIDLGIDSCVIVDGIGEVKVTVSSGVPSKLKFVFYDVNDDTVKSETTTDAPDTLETKTYSDIAGLDDAISVNVAGVVITEAGEEVTCGLALASPKDCV